MVNLSLKQSGSLVGMYMTYFKVLCTFQIVSGFTYDICCFELVNKYLLLLTDRIQWPIAKLLNPNFHQLKQLQNKIP